MPCLTVFAPLRRYLCAEEEAALPLHWDRSLTTVITRLAQERGTPNVFPSWQLIGAVLGVDILASLFALFGWLSGPAIEHGGWVDIVTVVNIWLFSFGVTIVILCVCELT